MSNLLAATILTTVEVICCIFFFQAFLTERWQEKTWKKTLVVIILISIATIISWLHMKYWIKTMLLVFVIMVCMKLYFKGTVIQLFFCSVGFYGLLIIIDRIMLLLLAFFLDDVKHVLQNTTSVMLVALLCKTILFLAVIIVNRSLKNVHGFYLIRDSEWIRFLYFPILSIVSMLIFILEGAKRDDYILSICIGLLVGNFFLFSIIEDIVKREKSLKEMQIAQERAKTQTQMYIQMNQSYEEQRKKIHEFKNHIYCVQGLLESKNVKRALEYTQKISNSWTSEMNYIVTNHPIVNAVLNQKYKQAKSEGILLVLSVSDMEELALDDEDIVILLTNLLDNAIEATRLVEKERRMIKCRLTYREHTLAVVLRNPVCEQVVIEDNRIKTTKADNANHGMGMANISQVVNKYRGNYIFSCTNGYFTSTVIMSQV